MLLTQESLKEKFIKKGFWMYFFTFLIGPIGYVIKVTISRDLSVADVGLIYGVISLITLISSYNDLGCTESLNFFLPKYLIQKEYAKVKYLIGMSFLMQIITSILICLILFVFTPWIAHSYFKSDAAIPILHIAGLFFIGINIFHVIGALFNSTQNIKTLKFVEFIRMLVTMSGALGLLWLDAGTLESYMTIWIIGVFVASILGVIFAYHTYYLPYFRDIKAYLPKEERTIFIKYALMVVFAANIGTVLSQIDMQLIIYMLGSEDAGYYSNYLSLIGIPFMIFAPIMGLIFPVVSELHGKQDTAKIQHIYRFFSSLFIVFSLWSGVFLFQNGEILSTFFFGEKFRFSGEILRYSALFIVFNILTQLNFNILAGIGKVKTRAKILLVTLVINTILNIVLITIMGVVGSALAVGISWIPLWVMTWYVMKEYRSNFDYATIFINIGATLVAFLLLGEIFSILPGKTSLSLVGIAILVNLVIFLLANIGFAKSAIRELKSTLSTKKT